MELRGWNVVDADRGVLWREYEFRRNARATMLVFRGADGLVVVSPGAGLQAADYDALKELGEVRALVANNTFHHLGQQPWRKHFPNAESFAAPSALASLKKKSGVPFRSIEELPLPPHVRAIEAVGSRVGEMMFTVDTARGSLWYTGDLIANMQSTPPPPVRWLFTLSGSAPGFKLFRLAVWFFIKDRRALKAQAMELLEREPPAIVVPAHGPAISTEEVAAATRAELAKL